MTSTFNRLRTLFEACVDLTEVDRLAWIEKHVPEETLRIELALMLAADRGQGEFLKRDVVSRIDKLGAALSEDFNPESLLGRRFGSFQLRRLLGQGGQGTVFLAERVADDFQQTVAVKLLRRGIHEVDEHRRFRREREILARFEHAGVARLIDGGVSGEGVPYLAMEYIDGLPIDQWCIVQSHDREAILRLFSQLCGVVAAAHRALIVHRDIKPSNVLVSRDGAIKVLDFGIARLLDEEDTSRTRNPMMTPGYAAPEQANGGAITLATDVHALGVLLRVLLTGEQPSRSPHPHTMQLPAELRWIIGKATVAEPELRYRDAAELHDDVQRFLASRPVRAHPPSGWYRTRKFVRRHRGGVLVTTAFVIAVLASLGTTAWQAKVAREQEGIARHEAERANNARDFVERIFDPISQGTTASKQPSYAELLARSVTRLDQNTEIAAPERVDLMLLFARLLTKIGEYEQASALVDRAGVFARANLATEDPLRAHVVAGAGMVALRRGDGVRAARDLGVAEQQFRAFGIVGMPLIRLYDALSAVSIDRGDADASLAYARSALHERESWLDADDRRLGSGYNNLAFGLEAVGAFEEAIGAYRKALDIQLMHVDKDAFEALIPLSNMGAAQVMAGHVREGLVNLRSAQASLTLAPGKPRDHHAINADLLCFSEIVGGSVSRASAACTHAQQLAVTVYGTGSADAARSLRLSGIMELESGDPVLARTILLRSAAGLDPVSAKSWRGRTDIALAELELVEDRPRLAVELLRVGLDRFGSGYPPYLRRQALALLALACAQEAQPACPEDSYERAARDIDSVSYRWSAVMLPAQTALARVELERGLAAVAATRLRHAIEQAEGEIDGDSARLVDARSWLAVAEAAHGDCVRARREADAVSDTAVSGSILLRDSRLALAASTGCGSLLSSTPSQRRSS